jgi:NADH-quinone oxidoreductase subunit J
MVYVGGILVLILFAVMLTNKIDDVKNSNPRSNMAVGTTLFVVTLTTLLAAGLGYDWPVRETVPDYAPTSEAIGEAFLGPYLLPFEIAGILLLAALLAAVVVARKEVKEDRAPQTEKRS